MKNKKFTYLLILSVAAVWGIIFYKLITSRDTEDMVGVNMKFSSKKNTSSNDYKLQDTFTLKLNYRDPFLGVLVETEKLLPENVGEIKQLEKKIKPVVNQSIINYGGYIINPGSKRIISILTIHGKERMMSEGEKEGEIQLLKNLRDSVKINYQNHTFFIKKSN